jgi:hypothetical protein
MMRTIKNDWRAYLATARNKDHLLADPPWRYNDRSPKSRAATKYRIWPSNDGGLRYLFQRADTLGLQSVFLWATCPLLEEISLIRARHGLTYPWPYVTTITWGKLTKHGKRFYGQGHHFRGATEHLLLFRRQGAPALRTNLRNYFEAEALKRTEKPHHEERRIIDAVGGRWIYLFSGPNVGEFEGVNIDLVDTCFKAGRAA